MEKPGKRRRGAQRQGELDRLHEQFGWNQYFYQFQQVLFIKGSIFTITMWVPGSWRPCREGQRSNWDELTEEPRDHGICRLENSIKLLDSQCKWKGRYSPQRYCAPAPGMNNDGEDGETLFQSKRFPFGEHFWPHIQRPGDGSMFAVKITMEQVNWNFVDYSMHIHGNISSVICKPLNIFPINNDEHLLYTRPPSTPGVTEMRLSCTSGQDVFVSSPDLSIGYSTGEDFLGNLQFKACFAHGRLQKLRSHLYIAIPSKPDTEARGPGQIRTQKTFLISLFSNY